jgi:hypothetical protein
VLDELAVLASKSDDRFSESIDDLNVFNAPVSVPNAEIRVVVAFSRRSNCNVLGARSESTIALTMLSMSIPEPIPVIPTMTHLVKNPTIYALMT